MIPSSIEPSKYIANYELNSYTYSGFWKNREYEHESEVMLIKRLLLQFLPDLDKRTIVDLGGAFGRLTPYYAPQARQVILADYSTNELKAGEKNLQANEYRKKISFLAMNAYKMPLQDNSVDSMLSVRVMHHFKTPEIFFNEASRVLVPGGVAIFEFAHKNHLLAIAKALLTFKLGQLLQESIKEVSHKSDSQGMKDGQVSIIYNFSLAYMIELAQKSGLQIKSIAACSFFRMSFLKRFIPMSALLFLEKFAQLCLTWTHITPSLFIVLEKPGEFTEKQDWTLQLSLACPTCQQRVTKQGNSFVCINKHNFSQSSDTILDLRDPRPEEITF